jgi:hypothetical protein
MGGRPLLAVDAAVGRAVVRRMIVVGVTAGQPV